MNLTPYNDLDDWHAQRWSKFTWSENHKLLSSGKGELFGQGAWTYIKEKALQTMIRYYERPELEENKTLLWGKIHEEQAFNKYVRTTLNRDMTYFGTLSPLFLAYEPLEGEVGGSPDGVHITSDYKVDMGLELKCPKNPAVHMERLLWKTQQEIKDNYEQCYCQIQCALMATGAAVWHFASFDDRQLSEKNKIVIIEVFPDKRFQENIDARLRQAIKEKYKIIDKYSNR